jgi:hypothetical protein
MNLGCRKGDKMRENPTGKPYLPTATEPDMASKGIPDGDWHLQSQVQRDSAGQMWQCSCAMGELLI